ncbi:hypothetical protein OV079_44700 [Nannocystis pusilla]|uniref:Uncharacterized protein n=1 Tax=Nannocystis pusilla TaxID=889268 RepID=A0A9X3EYC6_9BACT|nr:hypothetical protein [Nannocystis pusilla]MCY1012517.1 hypothetical protein [Nannocystis pusilla]
MQLTDRLAAVEAGAVLERELVEQIRGGEAVVRARDVDARRGAGQRGRQPPQAVGDLGAHDLGRGAGAVGDLAGAETLEVGQLEGAARLVVEVEHRRLHGLAQRAHVGRLGLVVEGGDLGVVDGRHASGAVLGQGAQGRGAGADGPPHAHAGLARVELLGAAPGVEEDAVDGALGGHAVAEDPQGRAQQGRGVALAQLDEGDGVAAGGGGHSLRGPDVSGHREVDRGGALHAFMRVSRPGSLVKRAAAGMSLGACSSWPRRTLRLAVAAVAGASSDDRARPGERARGVTGAGELVAARAC